VLVNPLTADRKLDILDRTLGEPLVGGIGVIGSSSDVLRLHLDVHISYEITIARDRYRDATGVSGSTVDGLLDVLHSEVSVATINRLEESNLGVASQVDILGTVSDELHETSGHFVCCCTI